VQRALWLAMTESLLTNPLLDATSLPRFDLIEVGHVQPGIQALLEALSADFEQLEAELTPTWAGLIEPIERLHDTLGFSWGIVVHLMGVRNSEALREAHGEVLPEVVKFSLRALQSPALFKGLCALRDGPGWPGLDATQRRIVEKLILEAELAGVGLEGSVRERFSEIQVELAELSTQFSNQLLDATGAFELLLLRRDDVAGLPPSLLELSAQSARESGHPRAAPEEGPWRITLDLPSFVPFMEHSQRRELRERLYRAYVTRASSGKLDNAPVLERILALRCEHAQLLDYSSYAELSLASKMAPDVDAVERLLEELRRASFGAARRELDELREFAGVRGAAEAADLALWDVAFWAERMREERFAYSEEELRPYFPLPRVLEGLFGLARRLFGVEIRVADGEAPSWHADVRFFRVFDVAGGELAAFYLDPYSRPVEKRGGAWMDECVGRTRLDRAGDVRLPVAYLVCNGTPSVDGRPSLMTFSEVETLFHEFGHGLQHMLTRVDYGLASGIRNIEWDAVELPSQFMENWMYQRETVRDISAHVDSGEPLPDELFEKIRAARTYRAGSVMLRQLYFGFTDLELHTRFQPGGSETPSQLQRRIAERATVMPPLAEDRFLCSFGHIFAGGYAAGYYAYKWAEVLSADAFAAFEEAGLDDPAAMAATGRRYRDTVLALGGSRPPMDVFREFRGREPNTEPLLRHSGLSSATG
jgi:oligopeptidase A